jgi:MSHA biogenesis protein MshQ
MGVKPNILVSTAPRRIRLGCVALLGVLLSLGSADALAVNITIAANTNWSAITTGSGPGGQPSSADNITVNATLTANVTNGTCATLALGNTANGTLTFSAATSNVTVSSTVTLGNGGRTGSINMTNGGTLTLDGFVLSSLGTWTQGAGTVVFTANNTLPNNNNFDTFNNVVVSAGTTTLGKSTTIDGDLTVNAGATLAPGNNATSVAGDFIVNGTINGTAAFTLSGSGTNIDGTGSITDTGTVTLGTGNKTILSTASLSFAGTVAINGARTITNNGSITVVGNLTGSVAGSTWVNAANSTLNAQGTLLTTGTLTANAAGNTVIYADTVTQVVKQPSAGYFNLSLAGTGSKTMPAGTMTIGGDLSIGTGVTYNGTTNNPVINLAGDFTNGGTFNSGTGVFTFNGASGQNITGTTTFTNMTVNDAGGINLANNVTVGTAATGTLTFTNGLITTGANNIIVASGATIAGPSASSYVVGNFQKAYAANANLSFFAGNDFPIGDASNFTPVAITAGTTTTAGSLTVSTLTPDHPQVLVPIASTGIDATHSVNRYWQFTNSGITVGTAISATFTFVASDVDLGANPAAFIVQRFDGTNWNPTSLVAANSLNTQVSNVTPLIAGNNDFAIGEPLSGFNGGPLGAFNIFETSTPASSILGRIYTKIVGATISLQVVALNAGRSGILTTFNTNPITVALLDSRDNTGALSATTNCRSTWTTVISSQALSPTWTNGRTSTLTITAPANAWRDVRVRVVQGANTGCSTDRFSIRPTVFTVTSTSATNNNSSGTPTFKTGQSFSLTAATGLTGYDNGSGATLANPQLIPVIDTTQVVGSPTAGTLAGTFGAASNGTATGSTFTYSEVGNFGLNGDIATNAFAIYDNVFTAVDQPNDCTANFSNTLTGGQYGCNFGNTAILQNTGTSGFGRFIPDHFAFTGAGTLTQGCSAGSFSYMGQPMSFSGITIEARNSSDVKTNNYAGAYAKLAPATFSAFGFGARDTGGSGNNLTPRIDAGGTVSSTLGWVSGQLIFNVNPFSIDRAASPDGPYSATTIGIAPVDTDSVAMQVSDLNLDVDASGTNDHVQVGNAVTAWRFGRLALANALGSEKLDLPIGIQTQYWAGSGFVLNTNDSCTSIAAANISLVPNYQGSLSATNMGASHISISGNFAGGVGNLKLTKPSPTASGSVDLKVNLGAGGFSYLEGNWGAITFDQDPTARANFGLYGGSASSNFLYFRENY